MDKQKNIISLRCRILTYKMAITRELSEGREITRGTFDPRTYREDDPVNWARKRKPDWMATTGKIVFTR